MSDDGNVDKAKGRVKEAAGDLTGDERLKNEGKVDRAEGSVKDKVGDAADKVQGRYSAATTESGVCGPPSGSPTRCSEPSPARAFRAAGGSYTRVQ